MRRRSLLIAAGFALLAACSNDTSAPADRALQSDDGIDLVQGMDASSAAAVDRAGIGGSGFPDSLKLTAEQKAKIDELHRAYQAATKADLEAVKAIEAEARAAKAAGKPRAEIATILAKAQPYLERIRAAFARLQAAIWEVYTPAQQAWIKSLAPVSCRNDEAKLTDTQIKQIRALKEAFVEATKDELQIIRKAHEEARAALAAGASREEVRKILAKADVAVEALRQAELRLKEAILALLTPEQRRNLCVLRALFG